MFCVINVKEEFNNIVWRIIKLLLHCFIVTSSIPSYFTTLSRRYNTLFGTFVPLFLLWKLSLILNISFYHFAFHFLKKIAFFLRTINTCTMYWTNFFTSNNFTTQPKIVWMTLPFFSCFLLPSILEIEGTFPTSIVVKFITYKS